MNTLKHILALTILLVLSVNATADTYTDANGIVWTYTVTDVTTLDGDTVNGACVTQIRNNGTSVVIPENINGIDVVAIGAALNVDNKEAIVSLSLPETVVSIGSNAFRYWTSLKSVHLPARDVTFGTSPFSGCSSLPVVGNIRYAGTYLVEATVTNQTTYTIKAGTRYIGYYAFSNCKNIESMDIPEGIVSIGMYAFYQYPNSSLTHVTFPSTLKLIDEDAFMGCRFTDVTIPGNVRVLGRSAFNCSISNGTFTLGEGIEEIGMYAFKDGSYETVNIPSTVRQIGEGAFMQSYASYTGYRMQRITVDPANPYYDSREDCNAIICTQTDELVTGCINTVIPQSVKRIGNCAFAGSRHMTGIKIPGGVTEIGNSVFSECASLATIQECAATPPATTSTSFSSLELGKLTLRVPESSVSLYRQTAPWNEFGKIEGFKVCATPAIAIADGKLVVTCKTAGAVCHTTVTCQDQLSHETVSGEEIGLTGQYTIRAYATADGAEDSEVAEAILAWVSPTADDITTDVLAMETSKAVVIRRSGSRLQIIGTQRGEPVELYAADGRKLSSVSATDGETVIPYTLQDGSTYILKYGGRTIKCAF